ncbi:cytosine/purine/uracil/thiamine/allantoin permease family protein [Lentilactobacillus kosonis]|uniref:Cytosine/purine/uracil/thiamine/allantoin permease family protein n=1 Tax=Lentilactobacillus kosonis TaxID=2810561 RepID=A0A401FJ97_9LACO|nr:cytosine/purine/uracil/thiamine/allantoin permease family protein [Lentilactobacillus kosonis]
MFLGPEIAIFLADYYLIANQNYVAEEFTKVDGKYWYRFGINWLAIVVWGISVISYSIFKNISVIANTVGATFVAMTLAAILYVGLAKLRKR